MLLLRIQWSVRSLRGLTAVFVCTSCQCPGPDILVCDEAHMIKNHKADITQALRQVRTHRRIALTGSPLQNNLQEYFCVSFAVLLQHYFMYVLSRMLQKKFSNINQYNTWLYTLTCNVPYYKSSFVCRWLTSLGKGFWVAFQNSEEGTSFSYPHTCGSSSTVNAWNERGSCSHKAHMLRD